MKTFIRLADPIQATTAMRLKSVRVKPTLISAMTQKMSVDEFSGTIAFT
jgi:hypothetical protein